LAAVREGVNRKTFARETILSTFEGSEEIRVSHG
jgi:hypothetical protein